MFFLNRMQVLFKLRPNNRKTKKGKPRPSEKTIYARITVNGQTADITTNVKVHPNTWNQAKQKVTDARPTAAQDNETLDRVKVKIKKAFNLLDQDDVYLTPGNVMEMYRGKKRVRDMLTSMLTRLLAHHENRVSDEADELATGKNFIAAQTYEVYEKYTNNILDYLVDSKQQKTFIDEVDENFMNEFRTWGNKRFSTNYLGKHLYYLKSLLEYALLKKAVTSNSIKPYKVEKDEPNPDDLVFLYPDELATLRTFDFQTLKMKAERATRLARLRDAYIFMQAIGTHHSEYRKFVSSPESFITVVSGVPFIKMKRNKTKKYLITPLMPINIELAEQYGGFSKLPTCSLTQFNDGLKLISVYCGINKDLTTKSARKTFADHSLNVYATDEDTTARMMGLSSTKYIKHYGRTDERRLIKVLGLLAQTLPVDMP